MDINTDPIIGERYFTDGTRHSVYWDVRGQYVLDDDGQKVYGVWIFPDEEPERPIVIDQRSNT